MYCNTISWWGKTIFGQESISCWYHPLFKIIISPIEIHASWYKILLYLEQLINIEKYNEQLIYTTGV